MQIQHIVWRYTDGKSRVERAKQMAVSRFVYLCMCVCVCVSRGGASAHSGCHGSKNVSMRYALLASISGVLPVIFMLFFFFWLRRFPGRSRGWSYVHIVRCLKRRSCGTRDGLCAQQSPVRPGAGQPAGESWNPFSILPQYLRKSSSVRLCLFRGKNLAEICDIPELFKFYNQEIEPNTEIVVILICYIGN